MYVDPLPGAGPRRARGAIPLAKRFAPKPKTAQGFQKVAQEFMPQRADGDCVPISLKNVTDEYWSRMQVPKSPAPIALAKFHKVCGYNMKTQVTGLDSLGVKKELNPLLAGYRIEAQVVQGGGVQLQQLRDVAAMDKFSYPLVTVSPNYFTDPDLGYRVRSPGNWHHNLVVFQVDRERVLFYDPWTKYENPDAPPHTLVKSLPIVRFRRYWEESEDYKDVFWLQPKEGVLFGT